MSNLILFPPIAAGTARLACAAPPDAAVREQALDIRRSFIVEAPAGSGKTALLIQRLLKLLADESVTAPEQVLAITFTNDATSEIRDRVLAELEAAQLESAQLESAQSESPQPRTTESQPLQLAAAAAQSEPPGDDSAEPNDFHLRTRALARAVLARDAELGWQLLDHPNRIHIRTIDSVCAEIARTLPILSGSGGRLAPTLDAAPLHREAARRTLLLLGSGDPVFDAALRLLLLHRDGNLAGCESLIADMLALRDQWGDLIPLTRPELDDAWLDANVLPRLERALAHAITATLTPLEALFPANLLCDLAAIAADLGYLRSTTAGPSPIACCAGIPNPPEPVAAHLDRWLALIHLLLTGQDDWRKEKGIISKHLGFGYDRKHPHHPRLAALLDQLRHRDDLLAALKAVRELPDPHYPANQWAVAKSLFRILSRALVELQFVFAERGQCDFTEVSLLARHALSSDSGADDLASALGARLQHLLVDEMQDTSTGQYELLERLTASWDGYSQTVFLVGDPRQSIYLFRQARVERFVQSLDTGLLGDLPLTRLTLTANFRSQRALVDQFNDDFEMIFPQPADPARPDPQSPPYHRAEPTLPASSIALGVAWHANPQPPSPPAPAAGAPPDLTPSQARLNAREIARIASDWLARTLPSGRRTMRDPSGREIAEPWRIAVLVRVRTHLNDIVAALRQRGLPFRAVEIETLRERQEVLDLTALTRALLHPADRVAALAVLRAPWCGLSLADLHTLTGADDSTLKDCSLLRLIEDRAHLLSTDSQQRLARVHAVLLAAAAARARLTTAQLVERAWRSLGGDVSLGPAELTNARRFFELLDAYEGTLESSAGRIDTAQLEDKLQALYAEPSPIPDHTAHVELLTIHNAKGREWDLVLIPALERRTASDSSRLLTWSVLDPVQSSPANRNDDSVAHIMLAPIAARGEEVDKLTRWLKRLHHARQLAEYKRLFYVACTRARQELHLFAAPRLTARGTLSPEPDSLLKAAWPAAQPTFVAALAALTAQLRQTAAPTAPLATPPAPDDSMLDEEFDIAATGEEGVEDSSVPISLINNVLLDIHQVTDENLIPPAHATLQRLPLTFSPTERFAEARANQLPYGESAAAAELDRTQFARPEGSFAARSFGNAVHECIEALTARIASGATPAALLAELPSWTPRIAALLRAGGLPRATVDTRTRETRVALENLLRDPDGQWLLAPHAGAASEFALTAWQESGETNPRAASVRPVSVRLDRIFLAGPEPHAPGSSHLWIVDYKTASHSSSDSAALAAFLAAQRAAYAPQLETYARILAPTQSISLENVRLALYLPALPTAPRLIWWPLS